MKENLIRCPWCGTDPLYVAYHDEEWGVPVHDDAKIFEFLTLEGAQAGLSWITVLRKRENYKKAFYNWDIAKIAKMTDAELEEILLDPGVVRNRLKIYSVRKNALVALEIQREFGSLDAYFWSDSWCRHSSPEKGRLGGVSQKGMYNNVPQGTPPDSPQIQANFPPLEGGLSGFPIVNHLTTLADAQASTPISDAISKDLKKRGMSFVGSTIIYAYMQATGMVDDHLDTCFRRSVMPAKAGI